MENLLANLKQVVCNDTSLRYYQFENKLKIYNQNLLKMLLAVLSQCQREARRVPSIPLL